MTLARQKGWNWREVLDFSASINPLGPSPAVREAILQNLDRIAHYPEQHPWRLNEALARPWNVGPDQILLGNGATELIHFFARTSSPEKVTLALPVFSEFHRAFQQAASADLSRPETWPQKGLLVLTRPANPLGFTIPFAALRSWLLSTTNPVLVDESFLDFSEEPSAAALMEVRPELFVLRSLTKFYALPGLRIGALISSSSAIARFCNIREPWQVNALAEEAALAAIADTEHSAKTRAFIATERTWLSSQLESLPEVSPQPTDANFIYASLAYPAPSLYAHLLERKIIIRVCTGWPGLQREAVRIAVRTRTENESLIHHWRELCAS